MTTLVEARAELHRLAERRSQLKLRIERRELVSRFRVADAAVTLGHRQRDQLLMAPVRYAAILAGDFRVSGAGLLAALNDIMHTECAAIAAEGREAEAT